MKGRSTSRAAEWAERLGRHPALAALSPDARRRLAATGRERAFARGAVVFAHETTSDQLALVLFGRLVVERIQPSGDRFFLRAVGPGAILGFSLAAGQPSSADVVAAEPSRVCLLSGAVLREVLAASPESALAIIANLAELVGTLTDELADLQAGEVIDRLRLRLERLSAGRREIAITHRELATNLGAERATISRALAALEREGLLRRHRGRLQWLG